MILIADSGSSKTSWSYTTAKNETVRFTTKGINPFFRSSDDIILELEKDLIHKISGQVKKVFFYGAGVVNNDTKNVVKSAIEKLFKGVSIEINSDLLAAARATLQHKKGIACILGTGSNSCLYDGEKIVEHVPPLGYILGDEGSGAVLGKKLLADYLKGILPVELCHKFSKQYDVEYTEFLTRTYKEEKPNAFLAGFMPFLKENITHDYCSKLVENSFKEFVNRNISQYSEYRALPVCFVGSVAHFFNEQLQKILREMDITCGEIIKEPLEKLGDFHLTQI